MFHLHDHTGHITGVQGADVDPEIQLGSLCI